MPNLCKTKEAATKIGQKIGAVLDVDLFEMRPRDIQIMKVGVKVDVSTPLRQFIRLDKKCYDILLKSIGISFLDGRFESRKAQIKYLREANHDPVGPRPDLIRPNLPFTPTRRGRGMVPCY
ncbi:hypothetical protein PIB30_050044 [Stylosanthes scabra]|uniref:Uncharacterized protein n=1 Tax=Stylosanthes scabra TaxID=79078 RepID=A0ABU6ZGA0_9FABA|nr:hypothetical protein [Stylosanthes scabra]